MDCRKNPRGRGQAEGQHQEAVKLALPLEPLVGQGVRTHMHMGVCRRDVDCAAVAGVAEEGATLPLERFHTEIFLAEIGVHAVAIPYELPPACPVKSDPEGQVTDQVASSAWLHYAGRCPCRDGCGNLGGLGPCRGQVRE